MEKEIKEFIQNKYFKKLEEIKGLRYDCNYEGIDIRFHEIYSISELAKDLAIYMHTIEEIINLDTEITLLEEILDFIEEKEKG